MSPSTPDRSAESWGRPSLQQRPPSLVIYRDFIDGRRDLIRVAVTDPSEPHNKVCDVRPTHSRCSIGAGPRGTIFIPMGGPQAHALVGNHPVVQAKCRFQFPPFDAPGAVRVQTEREGTHDAQKKVCHGRVFAGKDKALLSRTAPALRAQLARGAAYANRPGCARVDPWNGRCQDDEVNQINKETVLHVRFLVEAGDLALVEGVLRELLRETD
jgi:hypothetical protein